MNPEEIYNQFIAPIEEEMKGIIGNILSKKEDAEDIFQNVCLALFDGSEKIDPGLNPKSHILRICINRARNLRRRNNWEIKHFGCTTGFDENGEEIENELANGVG